MHSLYNISVLFYGLGIRIASLFNPKAKAWVKGRKGILDTLPKVTGKNVIWFHCASLGEFDQGLPLMDKIKEEDPSIFLLITFFSPSGMDFHHKRQHKADHVMYLPLDTPRNAKRFIEHFKPNKALFVKYEFWSNHIFAGKANGTEFYNVSGLFRQKHRFFKWYGGFFRRTLQQFDHFFVQNEDSKQLLNSININQVTITGDSRFDRVIENKSKVENNEIIEQFKNGEELFIIGSSWPDDEKILAPWINAQSGKVLVAPHNVDEEHVKGILSKVANAVLYTQASGDLSKEKVMILDTIGQLANAYAYGEFAYVGGGFSGSLHNILEPAVFGLPVIFGPKHERFPEAETFIQRGFGISVATTEELSKGIDSIKANRGELKQREMEFVAMNAGASEKIYQAVFA
ncbi:MAG: glycosyltransferase N-terminal domain-containing protein [Crocinitomicaceae bacterium]|nr:glycosyltransferase N-terminal domain-containing protein [Crocinitomicaceae bacterium]